MSPVIPHGQGDPAQAGSTDRESLSPDRRYRDTADLAGAAQRIVRVVGARLADDDPDSLALLAGLDAEVKRAWRVAVRGMRQAGFSDREIGEALGITKQTVQERWERG